MLFVGYDWAEEHHDVELQDETGKTLRARLPEGAEGIARFHELVGECGGEDLSAEQVLVGIETDRGPWVAALVRSLSSCLCKLIYAWSAEVGADAVGVGQGEGAEGLFPAEHGAALDELARRAALLGG